MRVAALRALRVAPAARRGAPTSASRRRCARRGRSSLVAGAPLVARRRPPSRPARALAGCGPCASASAGSRRPAGSGALPERPRLEPVIESLDRPDARDLRPGRASDLAGGHDRRRDARRLSAATARSPPRCRSIESGLLSRSPRPAAGAARAWPLRRRVPLARWRPPQAQAARRATRTSVVVHAYTLAHQSATRRWRWSARCSRRAARSSSSPAANTLACCATRRRRSRASLPRAARLRPSAARPLKSSVQIVRARPPRDLGRPLRLPAALAGAWCAGCASCCATTPTSCSRRSPARRPRGRAGDLRAGRRLRRELPARHGGRRASALKLHGLPHACRRHRPAARAEQQLLHTNLNLWLDQTHDPRAGAATKAARAR